MKRFLEFATGPYTDFESGYAYEDIMGSGSGTEYAESGYGFARFTLTSGRNIFAGYGAEW